MDTMTALAVLILIAAALLVVVGILVLGIAAYWWAQGVRMAHTARAHAAEADERQRTIQQAEQAFDELKHKPPVVAPSLVPTWDKPSDEELMAFVRASRNGHADDESTTTEGNEGIPEQPPIPGGGMYRDIAGLE